MEKNPISKATLGRLSMYLEFLNNLSAEETPYISATTIARSLNLGEVQVRKDLNRVSGEGRPKTGYVTQDLITSIEDYLGCKNPTGAIIVGTGKLGKALLGFQGFENYGVSILAAFDRDENVVQEHQDKRVFTMDRMSHFCSENDVRIGIITVGEDSAQAVCDQMVESGIRAIWNFAPCRLNVPREILVKHEILAVSLAYLNKMLSN